MNYCSEHRVGEQVRDSSADYTQQCHSPCFLLKDLRSFISEITVLYSPKGSAIAELRFQQGAAIASVTTLQTDTNAITPRLLDRDGD